MNAAHEINQKKNRLTRLLIKREKLEIWLTENEQRIQHFKRVSVCNRIKSLSQSIGKLKKILKNVS